MAEQKSNHKKTKPPQWGLRITALSIFLGALYIVIDYHPEYTYKTRFGEAINMAKYAEIAIEKYFNEYRQFPSNNLEAGFTEAPEIKTSAMSRLEISTTGSGKETKALIILTFNKKLSEGKTLILSASFPEKGGKIIWDCTGGTLDPVYRFIECRP